MRLLFFLFFVSSASGMAPLNSTQIDTLRQQKRALENKLNNEQNPEKQQAIAQLLGSIEHVLRKEDAKRSNKNSSFLTTFPEFPTEPVEDEREPLIGSSAIPQSTSLYMPPSSKKIKHPPSMRLISRGPGMPHKKRSLDSCCLSWLFCCR